MINGPMVGGFLIAAVLVCAAFYAGTWFRDAVQFGSGHSLDAARSSRAVVCSFSIDEFGGRTRGTIRARDGLIRFDIHDLRENNVTDWSIEVDMKDGARMMTQAAPGEPYVRLDDYPDLRVEILEELKRIMNSDRMRCSPWWSAHSFVFELQGRL